MMMIRSLAAALLLVSGSLASPVTARTTVDNDTHSSASTTVYDWSSGWTKDFPIHESCNSTLRAQLAAGLDDAVRMSAHARDHLLRFGHSSDFVKKYFGNGSTAAAVGWFDRVVSADKSDLTFRCDDPDQNCATQDAWAGHWRGENATTETVICPLSFEIRRSLTSVCGLGFEVATSELNVFWATDLLHRVFHIPSISELAVEHIAEGYEEVLALAESDPSQSVINTDTLQYFAIDVWAYDIAAPGVGCTGKL